MKPILSHFLEIMDTSKKPTLFEIGACDGFHTQIFASLLRNMSKPFVFHSFEPVPELEKSWLSWTCQHRGHIQFFPMAVGIVDGDVPFHFSYGGDFYGSSSIRKPTDVLHKDFPEMKFREGTVKSTRLDTHMVFYPEIDVIDFIHMDVQGAEVDVFKGGVETLKKTRYVYTEYVNAEHYEGELGLAQLLELLGPDWVVVEDYGGDVLLRNKLVDV
jgi:FkbM family methyltransferase